LDLKYRNVMSVWVARKFGKLKFLLTYFIVIILTIVLFALRAAVSDGYSFMENIIIVFIFLFLFVIFALTYPPVWIIRKKFVTRLEIDSEKGIMKVLINKRIYKEYKLNAIFYYIYKHKYYNVLVFYEIYAERHGKIFYRIIFDMIGNILFIQWGIRDVLLIEAELQHLNIKMHPEKEKNMIDRF